MLQTPINTETPAASSAKVTMNRTFSPGGFQGSSGQKAEALNKSMQQNMALRENAHHLSSNSFNYKPKIVSLLGSGTATLNNIELTLNTKENQQKKMFSKTGSNIVEGFSSDSKKNNFMQNHLSQFNSDSKKTNLNLNGPIKPVSMSAQKGTFFSG